MELQEETIYNPYNENNKEVNEYIIKNILETYGVFYNINDVDIFRRSFVHKSYVMPKELDENVVMSVRPPNSLELKEESNERLEFLGDGILENITKFYLYKRFPNEDEGFMTEKKIALVKNDHIGNLAFKMGLHNYYLISKNAEEKKIRHNFKKLGCLFESFLGALFLDANNIKLEDRSNMFSNYFNCGVGFQVCQIFVESIFEQCVDWNSLLENDDNYKNIFQVILQKEFKTTPDYVVLNIDEEQKYETGIYLCLGNTNIHNCDLDNAISFENIKSFQYIKDNDIELVYFSKSSHKIKKKAEQMACEKAINIIKKKELI